MTPGPAEAQRHASGSGSGWGWGTGFVWGFGLPYYGGYYYSDGLDCGWVRVRVWRNHHRVWRRVWRWW
jgi:hypothetical protein